jgi:hypothetical protein
MRCGRLYLLLPRRPGSAQILTAMLQSRTGGAAGARLGRRVGLRRVGAGAAIAAAGGRGGRRQRAVASMRMRRLALARALPAGGPARVPAGVLGAGAQRIRIRPPSFAHRNGVGAQVGRRVGRAARGAAAAARAAPARGGAAAAAAAAQPLRVALVLPLPAAPRSQSRSCAAARTVPPSASLCQAPLGCVAAYARAMHLCSSTTRETQLCIHLSGLSDEDRRRPRKADTLLQNTPPSGTIHSAMLSEHVLGCPKGRRADLSYSSRSDRRSWPRPGRSRSRSSRSR